MRCAAMALEADPRLGEGALAVAVEQQTTRCRRSARAMVAWIRQARHLPLQEMRRARTRERLLVLPLVA